MPVSLITYQPNIAQLLAAYRPIRFIVVASATDGSKLPPFVACDIYIADVYYKTKFSTAADGINELDSQFSFDIAEALQEYFQPDLAAIDNSNVLPAPHMSAKVYCKFRASGKDADGFTIEEPTRPVQGTKFTDPVSGTGLLSNSFFVINATLQHEDHQNLASHLSAYRQGGWNEDAFPMTHRSKYFFCPDDSDHFPVIYRGECLQASLKLYYRLRGSSNFQIAIAQDFNTCDPIAYELSVLFNRVTVTMAQPIPAGHSVLVQYKRQSDAVWIDAGAQRTAQQFNFGVGTGINYAGDYDIRIIHFCSPCLSATPVVDTFTLAGVEVETEWRGIQPYCVQQVFAEPIYISLELRNLQSEESFFPSTDVRQSRTQAGTADLFVKFFSDAFHLNPLGLDEEAIRLFLKVTESRTDNGGTVTTTKVIETVQQFDIVASGTEFFVAHVATQTVVDQYQVYPTIISGSNSLFAYAPYPTHQLIGGNTGEQGFAMLRQYNVDFNLPVLSSPFSNPLKPNVPEDPDYIAPSPSANCPAGPDKVFITYGEALQVAKVEIKYNGQFVYPEGVNNTQAGGYQFVLPVPKNTNVTLAVKAKTLDPANLSGKVHVRVTFINAAGILQTVDYPITNNLEVNIPSTFKNITSIKISNF